MGIGGGERTIIFINSRASYHFPCSTGLAEYLRHVVFLSCPFPSPPLTIFLVMLQFLEESFARVRKFVYGDFDFVPKRFVSSKSYSFTMEYLIHKNNHNLSETFFF